MAGLSGLMGKLPVESAMALLPQMLTEYLKEPEKRKLMNVNGVVVDEENPAAPIADYRTKGAPAGSQLSQWREEMNALDPADPFRQIYQRKIDMETTRATAGEPKDNTFDYEGKVRGEFQSHPIAKEYVNVRNSVRKIESSLNAKTAAGDMAGIFSFMKTLDPTSTVREGEQASVENARGVPDTFRNLYNKAASGERLTPDQRADFISRAKEMEASSSKSFGQHYDYYTGLAKQYKLDPAHVVLDYRTGDDAPAKSLQVGAQEDGYEFLGGDPAKPESWKKL
jgi:hypothetical protein